MAKTLEREKNFAGGSTTFHILDSDGERTGTSVYIGLDTVLGDSGVDALQDMENGQTVVYAFVDWLNKKASEVATSKEPSERADQLTAFRDELAEGRWTPRSGSGTKTKKPLIAVEAIARMCGYDADYNDPKFMEVCNKIASVMDDMDAEETKAWQTNVALKPYKSKVQAERGGKKTDPLEAL